MFLSALAAQFVADEGLLGVVPGKVVDVVQSVLREPVPRPGDAHREAGSLRRRSGRQ